MRRGISLLAPALIAAGCGGSADGPGGAVLNPGPVTLDEVQAAIFTPSCAISGCHVGGGAPLGLDLSTGRSYGNVVDVPSQERPEYDRIEPLKIADSYLLMKVRGDTRIFGDPMPAEGDPLSDRQIELLEDWIDQGARP